MSPRTAGVISLRFGIGVGAALKQSLGVRMQRLGEELLGRRLLDDPAQIHDGDVLADVAHHRQVVRDEQVGEPEILLQTHQQVENLRLDRDVERRDRLVGDDEVRLDGERPRDADALPLSTAELVRLAVGELRREPDAVEQFVDPLSRLAFGGDAVHAQHLPSVWRTVIVGLSDE